MDYTTTALVKAALHIADTADDDLIARFVTAASRAIDTYCAGTQTSDYFQSATVTDEVLRGQVDEEQYLHTWPHKATITQVISMNYRFTPRDSWTSISVDYIIANDGEIIGYQTIARRGKPWVKTSYIGGLAEEVTGLPADFVEAATVLAARFYREAESGLTDAVGLPEIGQISYTKAMPARVKTMLQPYKRCIPW